MGQPRIAYAAPTGARVLMNGAFVSTFGLVLVLKTSVSTSACKSCSIAASDYDQSCTQDSDCTAIDEGDICSQECPGCANAAINVRDEARYRSDLSSMFGSRVPCSCAMEPVACEAGICSTTTFSPIPPETVQLTLDAAADMGIDAATDAANDAKAE